MWKKVLLGAGLLAVAAAAVMVMKIGPRNVVGMIRYDQRKKGTLKVGDRAPAATLVSLDGKSREPLFQPGDTRPAVLIFGSFT